MGVGRIGLAAGAHRRGPQPAEQDGGFRPIPTAAILRHIAREIDPPPRTIVYSYVASKKTS